jgi:hypothetical protein
LRGRSLVELRVFHGDTCERLNEEIGNMWGVLSRDVGNRGWRGRECEDSIIAGEIGYEIA